jgi:hypothetical protein
MACEKQWYISSSLDLFVSLMPIRNSVRILTLFINQLLTWRRLRPYTSEPQEGYSSLVSTYLGIDTLIDGFGISIRLWHWLWHWLAIPMTCSQPS